MMELPKSNGLFFHHSGIFSRYAFCWRTSVDVNNLVNSVYHLVKRIHDLLCRGYPM